jgi:hypothetical protein
MDQQASAPPCAGSPESVGSVDSQHCFHALTRQEVEACESCVSGSRQCHLQVLPNHMLTETGEINGFCFTCSASDCANVIPMSKNCFGMTAVYECHSSKHANAYISIMSNLAQTKQRLQSVVDDLKRCENKVSPLSFECMHDWTSTMNIRDQRMWSEGLPAKMGVYHCFMRTNAQNEREHKVFVVVSGNCRQASEELYNLWLDARDEISVVQFMECAEVAWLRQATMRWLNRVAWRVMNALELSSNTVIDDMEAVGARVPMLMPTTYSVYNDMCIDLSARAFFLTNNATLLHGSMSGVVFDCFASEGFWIYHGARDTSSYKIFGAEFRASKNCNAFPTKTVCYHKLYPCKNSQSQILCMRAGNVEERKTNVCIHTEHKSRFTGFMFPDAGFTAALEKLGFSANNGVTNLMPIVMFCGDE